MSKITKVVSATLLASAAVVSAPSAFAGSQITLGPTNLYVAVWNTTTSTSIVEDLGTPLSDLTSTSSFESSSGYTTSWAVDSGAFATDLGTTSGSLRFSIFAGDIISTGNAYIGDKGFFGYAPGFPLPIINNGDLVDTALTSTIGGYLTAHLGGSVTTYKGTGVSYWGANLLGGSPTANFQISAFGNNASARDTGSLNFYLFTGGGTADSASDSPVITQVGNSAHQGVFTFNAATGVLTYTLQAATTAVPLPAAGWLLISGLFGLGAVGRRRTAVAA
jgi:hypothetical protein